LTIPARSASALELIEFFRASNTTLGDSRIVMIDHSDKVDMAIGEASVRF